MKKSKKIQMERLLCFYRLLRLKGRSKLGVPTKELIHIFQKGEKTFYRDVRVLNSTGYMTAKLKGERFVIVHETDAPKLDSDENKEDVDMIKRLIGCAHLENTQSVEKFYRTKFSHISQDEMMAEFAILNCCGYSVEEIPYYTKKTVKSLSGLIFDEGEINNWHEDIDGEYVFYRNDATIDESICLNTDDIVTLNCCIDDFCCITDIEEIEDDNLKLYYSYDNYCDGDIPPTEAKRFEKLLLIKNTAVPQYKWVVVHHAIGGLYETIDILKERYLPEFEDYIDDPVKTGRSYLIDEIK